MATDVGTLQGSLELDMSQFNKAMNQATNLVRKFGQQLQKALGSSTTQGFSDLNQAITLAEKNMISLTATSQRMVAALGKISPQMAGIMKFMQTNSTLGKDMSELIQQTNSMTKPKTASTKGMGKEIRKADAEAKKLDRDLNRASGNANNTAQNMKQTAAETRKAANAADSLSKNMQQNTKHIIEGIIISQTFYQLLGTMRDLVDQANYFMLYMEQSSIAFKYLLGSADDATGLLQALQDFSVSSPLDMRGATSAARMLMTMGIEAQNTVGVLRVLTDTAAVAGGEMEDTVNRLSLAIGQMLQSGTVKAQEVRQLVNANIPIYEILQEELNLTSKQVANIGKESIDSATAVNAILRGLQKRFGGASKEMEKTLTGAISACKDSFYILYSAIMQNPFDALRDKVVQLSGALQYMVNIVRNTGVGGLFEAIVPEYAQPYIRNLIGALQQLGYAFKYAAAVAGDIFGAAIQEVGYVLNLILPPINIFLNAILQLSHYLLQTYPIIRYVIGAFLAFAILRKIGKIVLWFWRIMGLGKICLMVAHWVGALVKMLSLLSVTLMAHPSILIFTVIAGAALVATGAIQKLINKLKELFSWLGVKWAKLDKTLNKKLNIGYDPNKILQPVNNKDNQKNANKYNNALQNVAGSLNDVGDAADKAGNKIKQNFNQSFDEVYTINPAQDIADGLGLGDIGSLDLSDAIGNLEDFNAELGELGGFDFSGWDQDFMLEWDKLWEAIKNYLKKFSLGALLAGLLTTLLTGNPWLGLAAALAALFWPAIAEKLGLTEEDGAKILGAAIGALLGAVVAKICKANLITGIVWAGIGALIFAGLWPGIQEYINSGDWHAALKAVDFSLFGAGIGAAIGQLIAGPIGAGVGLLIGAALTGGVEGAIDAWADGGSWKEIAGGLDCTKIGAGLGASIGLLIAGPLGGAVGTAIGGALGAGIQGGIDEWANDSSNWKIADAVNWTLIGTSMGTAIGLLIAGPLGAAIGAVIGGGLGFIGDKIAEVLGELDGDWELAKEAFRLWGEDIKAAFLAGIFGSDGEGGLFSDTVSFIHWAKEYFARAKEAFKMQNWGELGKDILMGILAGITAAISLVFEPIAKVFTAIINAFCAIFGIHSPAASMIPYGQNILLGLLEGLISNIALIPGYIAQVGAEFITSISTWFVTLKENIFLWYTDATTGITTWVTESATLIGTWVTNRITDFTNWSSNTITTISTWVATAKQNITDWGTSTKATISEWVTSRTADFNTWKTNTLNSVTTWATSAYTTIATWATDTASEVSSWWTDVNAKFEAFTGISFSDWCSSTLNSIKSWATDLYNVIADKIGAAIEKVKEFLNLDAESKNYNVTVGGGGSSRRGRGHAEGGVFDREHWARFAEGNKAEAIIPLENNSAMKPFVDAVSSGITASLAPILASQAAQGRTSELQPLYVGTLIADERGLKELERKMQIIRVKEDRRG